MCTVAPRVTYRHSIGEVWYSPDDWYRPAAIEKPRVKKRLETPPRPKGTGFQSRLWDNLYGDQAAVQTQRSRLELDIYARFQSGSVLRDVLKEVEGLVEESEESLDSFDVNNAPWDQTNSAVLNKMYKRVQDTNKRNSFTQRKRRGSNILQSIFPLRKLSSQSIKKHIAKCSGPLFKLKHSDIKLSC